jgi:hypothetical protein
MVLYQSCLISNITIPHGNSVLEYYIRYMIYTFTLCKETNCGKFTSVYQHFKVVICTTTHADANMHGSAIC